MPWKGWTRFLINRIFCLPVRIVLEQTFFFSFLRMFGTFAFWIFGFRQERFRPSYIVIFHVRYDLQRIIGHPSDSPSSDATWTLETDLHHGQ